MKFWKRRKSKDFPPLTDLEIALCIHRFATISGLYGMLKPQQRVPTSVRFAVPRYFNQGDFSMSTGPIPIAPAGGKVAAIPLIFNDQFGDPIAAPAGGSITFDSANFTGTLSADGSTADVSGANTAGAGNLIYANSNFPQLTDTVPLTIATPVPTSVSVGTVTYIEPAASAGSGTATAGTPSS